MRISSTKTHQDSVLPFSHTHTNTYTTPIPTPVERQAHISSSKQHTLYTERERECARKMRSDVFIAQLKCERLIYLLFCAVRLKDAGGTHVRAARALGFGGVCECDAVVVPSVQRAHKHVFD